MPVCTQCGQENPAGFRFCPACGAVLAGEQEAAGARPEDAESPSFGDRNAAKRFLGEGGKKKVYLAHDGPEPD